MQIKDRIKHLSIALLLTSPLLLIVVLVLPLIWSDPILLYDDIILVRALQSDSLISYAKKLYSLQTIDIQPIRDVLLLAQIYISNTFFSSFHLVNFLLFFTTLYIWLRVTKNTVSLQANWIALLLGIAWISTHGAWVFSLSWVSAQKHWLALLFVLLAFDSAKTKLEEGKKIIYPTKRSIVFAIFSMLSHPILATTAYLPLLQPEIYREKNRREMLIPCLALAIATTLVLILNIHYYKDIYPSLIGFTKLQNQYDFNFLSNVLLRLGRYCFNLIFPAFVAVTYAGGSWQNIVGLPIAVILVYLIFKLFGSRVALPIVFCLVIPFFATAPFQSGIFLSDTYLLLPTAVVGWVMIHAICKFPKTKAVIVTFILVNLVGLFDIPTSFS